MEAQTPGGGRHPVEAQTPTWSRRHRHLQPQTPGGADTHLEPQTQTEAQTPTWSRRHRHLEPQTPTEGTPGAADTHRMGSSTPPSEAVRRVRSSLARQRRTRPIDPEPQGVNPSYQQFAGHFPPETKVLRFRQAVGTFDQ